MTSKRWLRIGFPLAAALGALLCSASADAPPPPAGWYSRAQASRGEFVYINQCVVCHGAHLEGKEAPPLQGAGFGRSMTYAKQTASGLFSFIRESMPLNNPGSLSEGQALDVTAYILEKNGFAPGSSDLTARTVAGVKLLPFPDLAAAAAPSPAGSNAAQTSVPQAAKVDLDDAALRDAAGRTADWTLPGRSYDNQRYSPLAQINRATVHALQPVAVVHTGMVASFETTPIVVDGIMYLTTPVVEHRMKILALDATTGATLWSTAYGIGSVKVCCGPNNRGVAVGYGNVYLLTLDDKLLVLDARTGVEKWEVRIADPAPGYSETMAPQLYDGMAIVGSSGGDFPVRGFVAAYDARSGKQRWRWYATDPKTFAGSSWRTGGGTVWTTPAVDPQRNLVIFSTGNPNPDLNGSTRAGVNLYTNSIVALDAHSGKLRWYYQEVAHDLWDYDAASNVVLFDVHQNGKTIAAAGEGGKVGWFFIVNRDNGKLIRRSHAFVLQNGNIFKLKRVLPGANGGSEWSPPAFSPQTHDVYLLGINQLMDFTPSSPHSPPGMARFGSTFKNTEPKVQGGAFTAIDVETGRVDWQHLTAKPMIGGALATAGGLVFSGEGDGSFEAYDAKTGSILWKHKFVAGVNAPAVSYEVNGTQYVAVAAGGNFQLNYQRGDAIGIFRLKP